MGRDDGRHMDPDEFRRWGHAVVDWLADYQRRVETLPVRSELAPGEVRAALPAQPPERGEPFDAILADVDRIVLPGVTHWQSPNFFAYFPANTSGPSILGDLLASGLGVQGMLWSTSPACTEIETHVLDWLVGMLGLPDRFASTGAGGGVIQDTASSATLCALLAARERATGFAAGTRGCDGSLVAYASQEAHSSVEKAVRVAGLGSEQLRLIPVDGGQRLRPRALAERMRADRAAGLTPCFAVATVGTTSTLAVDPVPEIAALCRAEGVWLHVDAAMAGSAALCPEFRWLHDGVDGADSYCFNPHKWLFTNFDCDCFWVADRALLVRTLSVLPEYLRNEATESGRVIDYRDWHVPLGRRFRALKLWFVIRHYGVEGLRRHLRDHIDLAQRLGEWVDADPRFVRVAPSPLNLVCFHHRDGDATTERILTRVNRSGRMFLTHTRLDGVLVLRMVVGQTHTRKRHVRAAFETLCAAAEGEIE
jgi:aromatic-L-amino-acid/L-tryptophan decarboxylase